MNQIDFINKTLLFTIAVALWLLLLKSEKIQLPACADETKLQLPWDINDPEVKALREEVIRRAKEAGTDPETWLMQEGFEPTDFGFGGQIERQEKQRKKMKEEQIKNVRENAQRLLHEREDMYGLKGMDLLCYLLLQIQADIRAIKSDVSSIGSDVSSIQLDIGHIESDTSSIRTDVGSIEIDLKSK